MYWRKFFCPDAGCQRLSYTSGFIKKHLYAPIRVNEYFVKKVPIVNNTLPLALAVHEISRHFWAAYEETIVSLKTNSLMDFTSNYVGVMHRLTSNLCFLLSNKLIYKQIKLGSYFRRIFTQLLSKLS